MRIYKPGERKGNRTCVVRGSVLGREYEVATDTTDTRAARRFAQRFEDELHDRISRERAQPQKSAAGTFARVAEDYADAVNLRRADRTQLDALKATKVRAGDGDAEIAFGDLPIDEVRPMHIAAAANALFPGRTNATKNRCVYTPAAAVLHFAAENDLCAYRKIRKLPEPKPRSRRPTEGLLDALIANAEDEDLRRFLVLIRWQGWRASETLAMRWEDNVDLSRREFRFWIPKAKAWKRIAMADAVLIELARVPEGKRRGKLFRWASYQSMDFHLKKLCKALKVTFTPHQARWAFASDLNDADTTTTDIANAGSWTSERSVQRYISADVKRGRAILDRLSRKA